MENQLPNIGEAIFVSTQNLIIQVVNYIPQLVAAIIVFIIGLLIAWALGGAAKRLIRLTPIDKWFNDSSIKNQLNIRMDISRLLGKIVKWFFIIVTLIAVADVLQIPQINTFLNEFLLYIPNVLAAVLILVVGFMLAEFVAKIVGGALAVSSIDGRQKTFLVGVTRYSLIVFVILAALAQLQIVPKLIQIITAGLSLAVALAVGLGAKDLVKEWLEKSAR